MNDTFIGKGAGKEALPEKYPVESSVMIKHKMGFSMGTVLSIQEAEELLSGEAVPKDLIPVKWGLCMSTFLGKYTEEELDEMQQEASKNADIIKFIKTSRHEVRIKLPELFRDSKP